MAEATNAQMQVYSDSRIRVRAEQSRALYISLQDDSAAIPDIYERAVNTPWADARTDGPPTLLDQQDVLVYNSVNVLLRKCIVGTATLQDVADLSANWPVFLSACVRPVEV